MPNSKPDFSRIVELSDDGYFRYIFDGGIVYGSPGFAKMTGWDASEPSHSENSLLDLVAPTSAGELEALVRRLRNGEITDCGSVLKLRGGEAPSPWIEIFLVSVTDAEGRPVGVDGLARDVSEHLEVADLLSRRSLEQASLLKAQRELLTTLNFDKTIESIVQEAEELLEARSAMLFLRIGEPGNLRPIAVAGDLEAEVSSLELEIGEGVTGWVVANGEPVRVDRLSSDKRGLKTSQLVEIDGGLLSAPLQLGETIAGALTVLGAENQYDDGDLSFLVALAQVASLALANSRTYQAVEELAKVDGLTGAFNRRFLDENLPEELKRADRMGYPVGLLMLDVDSLKRVNDAYGHVVGDTVLCQVVGVAKNRIRETDWVARYGGDEFVIVLPGTSASHLRVLGEALLEEISQARVRVEDDDSVSVQVSGGGAIRRRGPMTAKDLLQAADAAERSAKSAGGNRLVIATAGNSGEVANPPSEEA